MIRFTDETLERLRRAFPVGCRVRLVSMDDPYTKLRPGETGTVSYVDSIGTIHVDWDCGSGLGIVFGVDQCEKID